MNHLAANPIVARARRLFGDTACRLQVAALPWRRGENGVEVLLITSRDTGRWVLPKGWPEIGEDLHDAAGREAVEEAGVKGVVSANEAGRYFYTKTRSNGEDWPCEVIVYPVEVTEVADKWKERGERTRRWAPCSEAAGMVNEADLGQVIAHFCANPG